MKITQIAGFLGCGKTTLLLKLSRQLAGDNERKVALVVNEIGEIPVDGKVIEESGMQVKDIGGGCICCEVASTFAKTIYRLYKDFSPDHVLVEPTGVAVPHQVKLAARMGGRDAKINLGPAIVLFDATRPAELLDMDMLGQLVTTQIKDADLIAISKVDAVQENDVTDSAQRVREYNPKAKILSLSSFSGLGVNQLVDQIIEWNE
jgi:G3E family GTPase